MAIAHVQQDDYKVTSTNHATIANDSALNTTTGNFLVVCITYWDYNEIVSSIADTAGNTYTKVDHKVSTGVNAEIWYAKNITGNANNVTTATFTGDVDYPWIAVAEFSGVDPDNPLDDSATQADTGGDHSSGNMTASTDDSVIIGAFCFLTYNTQTLGSGFTDMRESALNYDMGEYDIVSSSGTYDADCTTDQSSLSAIVGAIFKGPSGTAHNQEVTEAMSMIDSSARVSVIVRNFDQTLTMVDSSVGVRGIVTNVVETISIVDSIELTKGAILNLAETITLVDSATTLRSKGELITIHHVLGGV